MVTSKKGGIRPLGQETINILIFTKSYILQNKF